MEPIKDNMTERAEIPGHNDRRTGFVRSVRRGLAAVGLGATLLGAVGGDVSVRGNEPVRTPLPAATDVQHPKESPTHTLSIKEIPLNPKTVSDGKFENFAALGPDKGFFLTSQYPTIVASELDPETSSMWITAALDGEKLTRENSGRFLSRGIYIDAYKYAGFAVRYQFDENTVAYRRETDAPDSTLIEVGRGPEFISGQIELGSAPESIITPNEEGTMLNIAPDKLDMNKKTFGLINNSLGTPNTGTDTIFELYSPMIVLSR